MNSPSNIVAAPAFIGQAGERIEQVEAAGHRAVAGFLAVDRHDHRRVDAVGDWIRDRLRPVRRIAGLAAVDQRAGDVAVEIRAERRRIGTAADRCRALGPVQLDDPLVEPQVRDHRLDRGFAHALLSGERREADLVVSPTGSVCGTGVSRRLIADRLAPSSLAAPTGGWTCADGVASEIADAAITHPLNPPNSRSSIHAEARR